MTNERKMQLMVGKTKKLLEAGFPVTEIANFLRLPEATIREYKRIIDEAKKNGNTKKEES